MLDLSNQSCEACRADAPQVTAEQRGELLKEIPQWQITRQQGVDQLVRDYSFDNFVQALSFTQKIGELAEAENHHPRIVLEWGRVEVRWWTHKIKGLHRNDFIMAAKSDQLVAG